MELEVTWSELCICGKILWGLIGTLMALAGGVLGIFVLPILGFGFVGIIAGSCAACCQGPAVAAGSLFAICQSLGATGIGAFIFGTMGAVIGGLGAVGVFYNYPEKFEWCCWD